MKEGVFGVNAVSKGLDQPAGICSLKRSFAIHCPFLKSRVTVGGQ